MDHAILDALERLYLFRKYEEGSPINLSGTPPNPYLSGASAFLFDSVIVLNYYESICKEILAGHLNAELLYDSIRNPVIGAKEILLTRYSDKIGIDQSRNYPNLSALAKLWSDRAWSYSEMGETKIPD